MRVKMLQNVATGAGETHKMHHKGREYDVDDEVGANWLRVNLAVPVTEAASKAAPPETAAKNAKRAEGR